MERHGKEWRTLVPPAVFNATLPPDDQRTSFICCTMYPAIEGRARDNFKVTREEVYDQCRRSVGKPIVDGHNNSVVVGKVIAAGVDALGRIWVRGAINYDLDGNKVLRQMRSGHYHSVSWRMVHLETIDFDDHERRIEKGFANLAITSEPEYPEAQIFFVADDPLPVKANLLLSKMEGVIAARLAQKQLPVGTEIASALPLATTPPMSETAAAATATEQAKPAETAATETAEAKKPIEESAPVPAPVAAPPVAQPVAQPAAQQVAPPVQPAATQPAATQPAATQPVSAPPPVAQPPVAAPIINYHFNAGFPGQNQFGTPSSAPPPPVQPTLPDKPMSTPAAAATSATTTPPVAEKDTSMDDFRRTLMSDMAKMLADTLKAQQQTPASVSTTATATPTPAAAATTTPPVASATPAPTEPPKSRYVPIDTNPVHDVIAKIGQMRGSVEGLNVQYESSKDMLGEEAKAQMRAQIDDGLARIGSLSASLIEGVESHVKNYRSMLDLPPNARMDGELARMKSVVATNQPLGQDDLKFLGQTLEFVSESSGAHQNTLEKLQQQRATAAAAKPPADFAEVIALREILKLAPKKRAADDMSQPQQQQQQFQQPAAASATRRIDPTEAFKRSTGLMWTLASNETAYCNKNTAPPSQQLQDAFTHEGKRARLHAPRRLTDSVYGSGHIVENPRLARIIEETSIEFSKGKTWAPSETEYTAEGWRQVQEVMKHEHASGY